MKQQKVGAYTPGYPKKALKGAALAAAALVALGTATGCRYLRPQTVGIVPMEEPTPGAEETCEPEIEGYIAPEDVPTEEPVIMGLMEYRTPEPEEVTLMGDVAVDEQP